MAYDEIKLSDYKKGGKFLSIAINTTLAQVVESIQRLEREALLPNPNYEFIMSVCRDLLERLPLPIYNFENSFVIRCRPNDPDQIFNSIEDISYNPYPETIGQGRFNLPGQAAFYAAIPGRSDQFDGSLTTIVESCKDLFDPNFTENEKYFTLSRWIVKRPISLIVLTFCEAAFQNSGITSNMLPKYSEFLGNVCSEEDNVKCKMFYDFFSSKAGRRHDTVGNYLITTAFFNALKEIHGEQLGILYSSSMTDNNGLNVVLSKAQVDSFYVQPDHVVMFKAIRKPDNFKSFTILPCSNGATVDGRGNFLLKKYQIHDGSFND